MAARTDLVKGNLFRMIGGNIAEVVQVNNNTVYVKMLTGVRAGWVHNFTIDSFLGASTLI